MTFLWHFFSFKCLVNSVPLQFFSLAKEPWAVEVSVWGGLCESGAPDAAQHKPRVTTSLRGLFGSHNQGWPPSSSKVAQGQLRFWQSSFQEQNSIESPCFPAGNTISPSAPAHHCGFQSSIHICHLCVPLPAFKFSGTCEDVFLSAYSGRRASHNSSVSLTASKASEEISEPAKWPPVSFLHKKDKILKAKWWNNA